MGAARSARRCPKCSARTWLKHHREQHREVLMRSRAKYTQFTDAAISRVNQGLQIICTDPGTTMGEKTAIMREIHERMATTMLAMANRPGSHCPSHGRRNQSGTKSRREYETLPSEAVPGLVTGSPFAAFSSLRSRQRYSMPALRRTGKLAADSMVSSSRLVVPRRTPLQ
jgi:hypothetical protein